MSGIPSMKAPLRHSGQLHPMIMPTRQRTYRTFSPSKLSPSKKKGKGGAASPTVRKLGKLSDDATSKSAMQDVVVGRARDDFTELLRQRGEVEVEAALRAKQSYRNTKAQAMLRDRASLLELLKKPGRERTVEDLFFIGEQLRKFQVFKVLQISPETEVELARIVDLKEYVLKGAVVFREGQEPDAFYSVIEGCLRVQNLAAIKLDTQADEMETWAKYILIANIVGAMDIGVADASGTSDPYVVVRVGTSEKQTVVKRETLNPIWDQTIELEAESHAEMVEISVWDYDAWGGNDYLGSVEVPLKSLRSPLHKFHEFTLSLENDPRYDDTVDDDEGGFEIQVKGTIHFHLQLTTEAVQKQIQSVSGTGEGATMLIPGDHLGADQVLHGARYPHTVLVEQASFLIRVNKTAFERSIVPLQTRERDLKVQFFSEITSFAGWTNEQLARLHSWFKIQRFKPGEVVCQQGTHETSVLFILSGEVRVTKKVAIQIAGPPQRGSVMRPDWKDGEGGGGGRGAASRMSSGDEEECVFREQTVGLGSLSRGDTLNLGEVLQRAKNAYTATAQTPVDLLAANVHVSLLDKVLRVPVEFNDGGEALGEVMIDAETLKLLVERAPSFPLDDHLAVQSLEEERDWSKYKSQLVSNIVFNQRLKQFRRGPAGNDWFAGRKEVARWGLSEGCAQAPALPSVLKSRELASPLAIKDMEKKGAEYDEYEGVMLSFEEQLAQRASRVNAQVFTYKAHRPPTARASYGLTVPLPAVTTPKAAHR